MKNLIQDFRAGDLRAGDELIKQDEKLVAWVYSHYFASSGCPEDDLIQEGRLGLLRALKTIKIDSPAKQQQHYKILWIKKRMYCFRKKFFRNYFPVGIDHEIEAPPSSYEKIQNLVFDLDNLIFCGKIKRNQLKKIFNKL